MSFRVAPGGRERRIDPDVRVRAPLTPRGETASPRQRACDKGIGVRGDRKLPGRGLVRHETRHTIRRDAERGRGRGAAGLDPDLHQSWSTGSPRRPGASPPPPFPLCPCLPSALGAGMGRTSPVRGQVTDACVRQPSSTDHHAGARSASRSDVSPSAQGSPASRRTPAHRSPTRPHPHTAAIIPLPPTVGEPASPRRREQGRRGRTRTIRGARARDPSLRVETV